MSDHADKLRELIPNGDGHYSEYAGILADAADHIEALQRENAELRAELEQERETLNPRPNQVSVWGMFDCHLFHKFDQGSVDEIIAEWKELNSKPYIPTDGGYLGVDLGPMSLCPIIVLRDSEELRRVGKMVHAKCGGKRGACDEAALDEWRSAALADPDVQALLSR